MDILPTQVCDDFTPTQRIYSNTLREASDEDAEVGILIIGSSTYSVKAGINQIGRDPQCNIVLNQQTVSKKHAEIEANVNEESAWICDLNSSNHTKLNNSILKPGRYYELKHGSILVFGLVQAVYKVHKVVDQTINMNTSILGNRRESEMVIPGTPDSSLDNSSVFVRNLSAIPATQTEDMKSLFRHPSLPSRSSIRNTRGSGVQELSLDNSLEKSQSSTVGEQKNVRKQQISIHDMETQKSFESREEEINGDDESTLKNNEPSTSTKQQVSIYDMETQHDINIIETKQPEKIETKNTAPKNEAIETTESAKNKIEKNITDNQNTSICSKHETSKSLEHSNNDSDKCGKKSEEHVSQKDTRNQLSSSIMRNLEEEDIKCDKSLVLFNLEHDSEVYGLSDEEMSRSTPPFNNSSRCNTFGQSSHNRNCENTEDKNTQTNKDVFKCVTRGVNYSVNRSLIVNDLKRANTKSVLRVYRRDNNVGCHASSNGEVSSSDSDTDVEGFFAEANLRQKRGRTISPSLKGDESEDKNIKNDSASSTDSDDLFNALTQPLAGPDKKLSEAESRENTSNLDYDEPTQLIDKCDKEISTAKNSNENMVTEVVDDEIMATQVLSLPSSSNKPSVSNNLVQAIDYDGDITEMEDHMDTQILSGAEKSLDTVCDKTVQSTVFEDGSIENIDYESAPTQLLDEVEAQKSLAGDSSNKTNIPEKCASKKNPLDDSLEKNLNEMFLEVNERRSEIQSQISTQCLENMLQSQNSSTNKTGGNNVDIESSTDDTPKKAVQKNRRRKGIVSSPSEKSNISNVVNINITDSQNSDIYFSTLTSPRKRNIIRDQDLDEPVQKKSHDKAEERQTTKELINEDNKNDEVDNDRSKVTPKASSTPRSTSKVSYKLNIESMIEGHNELKETSGNMNDEKSADDEKMKKISSILEDDDNDILAGLPEVKIAGTLSNPPSPTSSNLSPGNMNNNDDNETKKVTSKKARPPRKTTRKSLPKNKNDSTKNNHTVNELHSSSNVANITSSLIDNNEMKNICVRGTYNENKKQINKTKSSLTKSGKPRKSKGKVVPESFSIDTEEKMKENYSVENTEKIRSSSKENVDHSSLFQVGKGASFETATATSENRNVLNSTRKGKRAYSMTDTVENNNPKKHKEDTDQYPPVATAVKRGRRKSVSTRKQPATILNYVTKSNSSVNTNDINNVTHNPTVDIYKIPSTLTNSNMSISVDSLMSKRNDDGDKKSKEGKRGSRSSSQGSSTVSIKNNENTVATAKPLRKTKQNVKRKTEEKTKATDSEVGEESQEVAMITSGLLKEQSDSSSNLEVKRDTDASTKIIRKSSRRKRKNTDTDNTESNTSSDVCEPNAHFAVPSSKAKHIKTSHNTSDETTDSTTNEISKKTNAKRGRARKSTVNSVIHENTSVSEDSVHNVTDEKNNVTQRRGRLRKNESNKKQSKDNTMNTTASSELNSSVETLSQQSILSRTRRSTSVTTSSPSRTVQKILFTGISSNEYNKTLKKLGASQVEDPAKCTVLVTDKVRRTIKFLCALGLSTPIVSIDWLISSDKAGYFVNMENYILQDSAAENKYGFKLSESLKKSKEHKLLEGYTIVLTPNVPAPPPLELKSIIASCGGKALLRPPSTWPQKAVIVSSKEDLTNAKKFLAKAPKNVTIQSTEFILTGILRQEISLTEFKLH